MNMKFKTIEDKAEWLNPETDTRNISDEFKGMSTEIIRMSLQSRRVPAVNIAMNLTHDFNKSSVLRSNECFAFREFVLFNKPNDQDEKSTEGIKKFDRRGSVGMQNYANIVHTADWFTTLQQYKDEGYTIFAVDNIASYNPQPIYDAVLPLKTVFVYGEEGLGLSDEVIKACDQMIYIEQYGICRSLNISQAAAICMYEYSRQNRIPLD